MVIDEKKMVEVENITRGSVSYRSPQNPMIKRKWARPGAKKKIPFGEVQEAFGTMGGERLFTEYLLIKDAEVREALELPVEQENMMDNKELGNLLKGNPAKLKEIMPKLSQNQKERLAQQAVEQGITNMSHIETIKEYTGIDVYKEIQESKSKEVT